MDCTSISGQTRLFIGTISFVILKFIFYNSIYFKGSWDSWKKKIPLVRSTNDFSTIINLNPGKRIYNNEQKGLCVRVINTIIKLVIFKSVLIYETSFVWQWCFCRNPRSLEFITYKLIVLFK